jgi:hypothetical protein
MRSLLVAGTIPAPGRSLPASDLHGRADECVGVLGQAAEGVVAVAQDDVQWAGRSRPDSLDFAVDRARLGIDQVDSDSHRSRVVQLQRLRSGFRMSPPDATAVSRDGNIRILGDGRVRPHRYCDAHECCRSDGGAHGSAGTHRPRHAHTSVTRMDHFEEGVCKRKVNIRRLQHPRTREFTLNSATHLPVINRWIIGCQ